jgi:peptidoglycan/xylan/chitin deacetylase (PgdA/CDA1 family)
VAWRSGESYLERLEFAAGAFNLFVNLTNIKTKVKFRFRREIASRLARRPLHMSNAGPIISFTFDDFPRSALFQGGAILREQGTTGTFFASFGLMGRTEPTGEIFSPDDLPELVRQKHEIGCHTFDHCHSWDTPSSTFEESVVRNRQALARYLPGKTFKTFSYPISGPRFDIKRRMARHFLCCRGGGQSSNVRTADLNHLTAFFIEQSKDDFETIERLIEGNARQKGWLIFATHDVSDMPTKFGCTPILFEKIVRCSIQSGARILPVHEALQVLSGARKDLVAHL